jgi:hypothetical protein
MRKIEIDIDDVTPTTRLGDLTVAQFVQLMLQLRDEIDVGGRPSHRHGNARPAVERLRRLLDSDDERIDTVKRAFRDLGANLPKVLLEIIQAVDEPEAPKP